MSMRVDSAPLISSSLIVGDEGLGVLAENIPSTGASGPGYVYDSLDLPTDNGKEIIGRVVTTPVLGDFFAYEDTSFDFLNAPDGVHTFTFDVYEDGIFVPPTSTATITIGGGITGTSTVTLDDIISNSSGIVAGATAGSINVTLEDAISVSSGIVTTIGTINTTLDDAVMVASGTVHVPITGTVSVTLADTLMVASGVVTVIGNVGTVNSVLDDAVMTASGNVFVPITGTVSVTLEDVILSSIGIVEVPIVPGSLVGTIGTSGTGNFTWWAVE